MAQKIKSEKVENKLYRIVNSAICFAIAYMLILFGYNLATAVMGRFFGMSATVFYYGVKLLLNKHHWDKLNVFFIFSFGTLYLVLVSMFCAYLFLKFKEKLHTINLVFLWGSVIGFSMFCGQFVIAALGARDYDSPFYQNLSIVFTWIYLPIPVIYLLTILVAALLVFLAIKFTKPFLSLAYSFSKVNEPKRMRKYFLETVVAPFLAGGLGVLFFTFPLNVYINLLYLLMIAIVVAIEFVVMPMQKMQTDEVLRYKKLQEVNLSLLLIVGLLLALFTLTWKGFVLAS